MSQEGEDVSAVASRLVALATRIERIAVSPETVRASWTDRLTRPFYRMLGWQPELSVEQTRHLLHELGRVRDGALEECEDELEVAVSELADNVEVAERACVVNGKVPTSQIAWLGRVARVLVQADRALHGGEDQTLALAAEIDPVLIAPPLAIAPVDEVPAETPAVDASQARLVELQLAAIDHIIEAARAESRFLERRRSLLEAARRLLLDADAAMPLATEGVRLRKRYLTEQIVHADRLQARGLSSHTSILHQARNALARGERGRLHAALVAMDGFAAAQGDLRMATLAQRALSRLDTTDASRSEAMKQRSMSRSVSEVMGADVSKLIRRAYAKAREDLDEAAGDPETYQLALDYLAPGSEASTSSALLSVDGCFDVGAPLAPVRIQDRHVVARVVRHPTSEMLVTRAKGPDDIESAVIEDPRSVLLDLAAGRLLARKFVRYEERVTERVEMMGEVRVYLLDGSTSMLEDPARARMRDAILTAELATLMRRFDNPDRFTRVVMYYRYFTKRMWPLRRVGTRAEALAAIGDVLGSHRKGGTNIEEALTTSFDMIRQARAQDEDLARGQVVLITDGEATVRERVVREARERVGEMPVAVSVIALGQQNDALRALVKRQRAHGERAFYHHIDDPTLTELAEGKLSSARALHLPDEEGGPKSAADLASLVGDVLEEAASLERGRHRVFSSPNAHLEAALAELGLSKEMMTDGQRALRDAADRDRRALDARYDRWFPPVSADVAPSSPDEDAVVLVLSTVLEVVSELGEGSLGRKADAIDVLERLLPDARLSPAAYDARVRAPSAAVAAVLTALHEITASAHPGS